MSGNPCHGSAIGGFCSAGKVDPELYVRWLQATRLRVPHAPLRHRRARAWAFGPEAEAVARKWLAFRYRLIPYLERVVVRATRTGLPVMRAMPLAFPATRWCALRTQFLCGESLWSRRSSRQAARSTWRCPRAPGTTSTRACATRAARCCATARRSTSSVFGREGHALPLGRAVQHTGDIDAANPLDQLWLFGAPANSLDGFTQARIEADGDGGFTLRTGTGLEVVRFDGA
ncbi:MAG: hypothetical protein IPG84_12120 [Betaproteobacteria bacterium]|nr:hypothetical protein [Betaproteobacteria bacterium]